MTGYRSRLKNYTQVPLSLSAIETHVEILFLRWRFFNYKMNNIARKLIAVVIKFIFILYPLIYS